MMQKKLFALLMAVVMAAGFTVSANAAAKPEKHDLKLSMVVSETSVWYKGAMKFAEDVNKKTDGNVTVEVYPNQQLSGGNQAKGVEMLMNGSVDFDMRSSVLFSTLDQKLAVMALPFLFSGYEQVDKVVPGEGGKAYAAILEEYGVKVIGYGENGFRQLTNNVREIKSPDDLKGLKIRVMGSSMLMDTFAAMGANPIAMSWAEVFTALQQKTIDGQENPTDTMRSSSLEEVQKFITMWNYSYDPIVFSINLKLWNSFSPELQKIIEECAKEACDYEKALCREADKQALDDMVARTGLKVYTPTAAEMAQFKEKSSGVVDAYKKAVGADFVEIFTR